MLVRHQQLDAVQTLLSFPRPTINQGAANTSPEHSLLDSVLMATLTEETVNQPLTTLDQTEQVFLRRGLVEVVIHLVHFVFLLSDSGGDSYTTK